MKSKSFTSIFLLLALAVTPGCRFDNRPAQSSPSYPPVTQERSSQSAGGQDGEMQDFEPAERNRSGNTRLLSGSEIYKKCKDAVFMVYTIGQTNIYQGSGFFIDDRGLALSNYHVFKGTLKGEEQIKLVGSDVAYHVKEVLAQSEDDDFILFRVNIQGNKYIEVSGSRPEIGDPIYTIGSPQGLENTFSTGTVSQFREGNLIQINAPIDHGSSGGVLLNGYGQAIGITTSGYDQSTANLNFAKSIDVVLPYLKNAGMSRESGSVSELDDSPGVGTTSSTDEIIRYKGFTVSYSHRYLIPNWVSYSLTREHEMRPVDSDFNVFHVDPYMKGRQATLDDYRGASRQYGLSRGHMAPKRDMKWSEQTLEESFTLTNVCPQNEDLNNGPWRSFEEHIRWLVENRYQELQIVCGPIMGSNKLGQIGDNRVYVPDAFFKAVLARRSDGKNVAMGVVMPNESIKGSYFNYICSVAAIEEATGFDLFAGLADEKTKATYSLRDWQ